jgi:hypothetical protein
VVYSSTKYSSKRYSPRIKAILEDALLDRTLNPQDWLKTNAPKHLMYAQKQVDLMEKTGLSVVQIRHYMHNNARKGKRIAENITKLANSPSNTTLAKRSRPLLSRQKKWIDW